jgi:DNA mismatch endonuclease (patch repair protein)
MTDTLSPQDRKKTMRAVKGKGTSLERKLWAMLAGMGVGGWRKNVGDMLGKPDVVFDAERVVIFVDGCFWHGCPHCSRPMPVKNADYWRNKIARNVARDGRFNQELADMGWTVVRVWEHELKKRAPERPDVVNRIRAALND